MRMLLLNSILSYINIYIYLYNLYNKTYYINTYLSIKIKMNSHSAMQIILLLAYLSYITPAKKVTNLNEFREYLAEIASSPYSSQRVKYIYFEVNLKVVKNVMYFSSLLEDFLLTINIRGTVYNIEDKLLIAIVPFDSKIDEDFLLNHFDKSFLSVNVRYPG